MEEERAAVLVSIRPVFVDAIAAGAKTVDSLGRLVLEAGSMVEAVMGEGW